MHCLAWVALGWLCQSNNNCKCKWVHKIRRKRILLSATSTRLFWTSFVNVNLFLHDYTSYHHDIIEHAASFMVWYWWLICVLPFIATSSTYGLEMRLFTCWWKYTEHPWPVSSITAYYFSVSSPLFISLSTHVIKISHILPSSQ